MKIILVKPPLYVAKRMMNYISYALPLGLLQIASILEKSGNEVKIIDCLIEDFKHYEIIDDAITKIGLEWDIFKDMLKKENADLIAVSNLFSAQADALFDTCRKCKEVLPDVPIIVGGVHPSSLPLECIKHSCIDFVGIGEGEQIMPNLVAYLKHELPKRSLLSVYYKENGGPVLNGLYPPIEKLDALPLPAYHLVNFSRYFSVSQFDATVRGGVHQKWATIITSRGCPYSCNFCSVGIIEGKQFRVRSATHVVREIRYLYDTYGIRAFSFDDSNFVLNSAKAEEVLDLIIESHLEITFMFPNGLRADLLSGALIKKLKKAGCEEITLAFEHGCQHFLNKVIKKNLDLQKALKAVSYISQVGIPMTGFFIFGMPEETKEIHEQNVTFIYKVSKKGVIPNINLAIPLPNTELEKTALDKGYLERPMSSRDYLTASNSRSYFKNLSFPSDEYPRIIKKTFRKALLFVLIYRPFLFLRHPFIKSLIKSFRSIGVLRIKIKKINSLAGF